MFRLIICWLGGLMLARTEPPFEISSAALSEKKGHKINRISRENRNTMKKGVIFLKREMNHESLDKHNKGILELKPNWFPKQSISKKGERTYYYWEF